MEIFLLIIIILILANNQSNALSFLVSIIFLGLAAYAVIWIGALAFVVALIGN
jgi:hypothetical protein